VLDGQRRQVSIGGQVSSGTQFGYQPGQHIDVPGRRLHYHRRRLIQPESNPIHGLVRLGCRQPK
jgi:hypothetical protein